MKTILSICAIAGMALWASCTITDGQSNIKYTQLPAGGKNIPVQPFTSIKANGVFNIILQKGSTESVVVKGYYPNDLQVTNDGNTLIIIDTVHNHNTTGNKKTDIYITFRQLNAIEVESVGETKTLDTIKTSQFTFESDGVGETDLLVDADSATISENGVGSTVIAGKAHYATIEDNGVGALKAKDFKVNILHTSVNGVGAAKVYADSEIYLDVDGIGGLRYYGPAKVVEQVSSGIGKVEHGEL